MIGACTDIRQREVSVRLRPRAEILVVDNHRSAEGDVLRRAGVSVRRANSHGHNASPGRNLGWLLRVYSYSKPDRTHDQLTECSRIFFVYARLAQRALGPPATFLSLSLPQMSRHYTGVHKFCLQLVCFQSLVQCVLETNIVKKYTCS